MPWLELRRSLFSPVVKDNRAAHTVAAIAIDGGDVWPTNSVVLEALVEGFHPHRSNPLGNQVADWVVHHRRHNPGSEAEAVSQIGGDIKLSTAHMNPALGRLPEWNNSRIQAMDQSAER